jgi:hypothetical protein
MATETGAADGVEVVAVLEKMLKLPTASVARTR